MIKLPYSKGQIRADVGRGLSKILPSAHATKSRFARIRMFNVAWSHVRRESLLIAAPPLASSLQILLAHPTPRDYVSVSR